MAALATPGPSPCWPVPRGGRRRTSRKTTESPAKRPVLQAIVQALPWGALGDILKTIMAPAYERRHPATGLLGENGGPLTCPSGPDVGLRFSDRLFAQGVSHAAGTRRVDFGITQSELCPPAPTKAGPTAYKKRRAVSPTCGLIARIESPAYLMIGRR